MGTIEDFKLNSVIDFLTELKERKEDLDFSGLASKILFGLGGNDKNNNNY